MIILLSMENYAIKYGFWNREWYENTISVDIVFVENLEMALKRN